MIYKAAAGLAVVSVLLSAAASVQRLQLKALKKELAMAEATALACQTREAIDNAVRSSADLLDRALKSGHVRPDR